MTGNIKEELIIDKMVSGGLGLARLAGEVILAPRALPGERIWAEISQGPGGVKRAKALEILKASPWRRDVDCPIAENCGGCDFIHVQPEMALALKAQAALGPLAERLGLALNLVRSPAQERYRHRATLHLGLDHNGLPGLGFFDTHRNIIDVNECRLLAPELENLLPPLKIWAAERAMLIPGRGREIEISLMREVAAGGQTAICFSPPPPKYHGQKPKQPALADNFVAALTTLPPFLAARGFKTTVFAKALRSAPPRRISKGDPNHLSAAFWPQWNLSLKVRPGGFTQVNPAVNALMVAEILNEAAKLTAGPKTALDLYAGLGNISLPLLKSGFSVTAVEQAPEGVAAAKENAAGDKGFSIICGQSEKEVISLARRGQKFDLIVLDPPRSGAKDMAPAIVSLSPEIIIYVACHPAVLERDLPAFVSLGYHLDKLTAFDMFPRTSHFESLAVLRRNRTKDIRPQA